MNGASQKTAFIVLVTLACLISQISGCATNGTLSGKAATRPVELYAKPGAKYAIDVSDPLEGFNRGVYRFNYYFDRYLFLPVVNSYEFITPDYLQERFSNFFDNIGTLTTVANCILQLRPTCSVATLGRILVNTTIGIGGLWDPATNFGMDNYREDFGQTLGRYGVGNGPYLVLPVLGPSNLRDTAGFIADATAFNILDPLNFENNEELGIAYTTMNSIDKRHRVKLRYFESGSPFEYELVRLAYTRFRQFEINK